MRCVIMIRQENHIVLAVLEFSFRNRELLTNWRNSFANVVVASLAAAKEQQKEILLKIWEIHLNKYFNAELKQGMDTFISYDCHSAWIALLSPRKWQNIPFLLVVHLLNELFRFHVGDIARIKVESREGISNVQHD